jgi:anthranilate/para-aminobenzoate synthase component I
MNPTPASPDKLRSLYDKGYSVPLIVTRKDPPDPWEVYERVHSQSASSFFLDSPPCGSSRERYSYVGWRPFLEASFDGRHFLLRGEIERKVCCRSPLPELRRLFGTVRVSPEYSFDFFAGGAVGYFGYELAEAFERVSFRPKQGPSFPRLGLLLLRDVAVFDHQKRVSHLISWLVPRKGLSFRKALGRAEASLGEMEGALLARDGRVNGSPFRLGRFRPEISKADFECGVKKAKSYIEAGDIYQANLSQRFSFEFQGSPLKLYGRLRKTNPSPFAACLRLGDLFIASSSPELLISKRGRNCVTRPIAGTRPRGRRAEETRRLARELLQSEKERAEHLMLVDLERNDLGRVSEWRSVRVKDFMRLEKYARVIHIVSEITSQLRPSKDAWHLIEAVFPGGTVTGCPKIRSMEIIDELEPVERGVYTGSIGYIGFDGNLTLNIAIRTLVLLKNRGYLQVGAGIVADSDPAREYEETLHKGEALAEALVEASQG